MHCERRTNREALRTTWFPRLLDGIRTIQRRTCITLSPVHIHKHTKVAMETCTLCPGVAMAPVFTGSCGRPASCSSSSSSNSFPAPAGCLLKWIVLTDSDRKRGGSSERSEELMKSRINLDTAGPSDRDRDRDRDRRVKNRKQQHNGDPNPSLDIINKSRSRVKCSVLLLSADKRRLQCNADETSSSQRTSSSTGLGPDVS
ncbi:unnamed protein product [Pleuronectes platessa]|uniref:Uncharacterized protein n=1 Tax=Pleuronectes platessa TaxID=8262 RepID=A0A9N7VZ80_PLEPL|nr:unnamed protein product [Pleuronectes platessa]